MSEWKKVDAPASKSTGPKTPEGKARSAMNARKHCLTSAEIFVPAGQEEEFAHLLNDFSSELNPVGIMQMTVFNQIVHAAWNLRRVRALEAEAMADPNAFDDPELARKLDRLSRYAKRFEGTLHRATKELRTLQTHHAQRLSILPTIQDAIPPLADPAKAVLAKRTTHPSLADGTDLDVMFASLEREPEMLMAANHYQRRAAAA